MAGAAAEIQVRGLTQLVRAFKVMPEEVVEEFVGELEEAANPVRMAAQSKAPGSMSGMGDPRSKPWTEMRVGIARRNPAHVYVVPSITRGRVRKQSQKQKDTFAGRLQEHAMDPALRENTDKVREKIEDMLDRIADHHGF